uniref:Uncharacterized protein n=1 Tax=Anguilla anguilla TaxID=7936 RepID=A0A0E9VPR1_ANGAN
MLPKATLTLNSWRVPKPTYATMSLTENVHDKKLGDKVAFYW